MSTIKVYIEGGGDSSKLQKALKRGFSSFFSRAGLSGKMPKPVACGSRQNAFDSFCTALSNAPKTGDLPFLLVDSETAVTAKAVWGHVKSRKGDNWTRPTHATGDHLHFMVECMEAWFMADKATLANYFGKGFQASSLPARTDIENIPKATLYSSLTAATRHTKTKGKYGKGEHSFEILGLIDPAKVLAASPYAQRLITKLNNPTKPLKDDK